VSSAPNNSAFCTTNFVPTLIRPDFTKRRSGVSKLAPSAWQAGRLARGFSGWPVAGRGQENFYLTTFAANIFFGF
jgi:hypothetical protein